MPIRSTFNNRAKPGTLPESDPRVDIAPGETMGSAFARFIRELFAPYGLLLIDPMDAGVRAVAGGVEA